MMPNVIKNFGKMRCEKCGEMVSMFRINGITIGNNTRSYRLCEDCTRDLETWIHIPVVFNETVIIRDETKGNYIPEEIK